MRTHTVKPGETLLKVARANGVTLAQLLDANPVFRARPDRIRAGDVLIIPVVTSTAGPPPPQPTTPERGMLGRLSEQFETSGRGPGTVSGGVGDRGGVSYGSYQMSSKPDGGTVGRFVAQRDFPFRETFKNLKPGGERFTAAWKALAAQRRDEFHAVQHEYIKRTHFDVLARKIMRDDGIDVLGRSHALQDVIWSTAVQHGGSSNLPHRALSAVTVGPAHPDFDSQFIKAIYAERGRRNAAGALVHFTGNSPAVQDGVAKRFQQEERKALEMLADEMGV